MRQSLMVGARPLLVEGREFPKVPVGPGGWRIDLEKTDGSVIEITIMKRVPGPAGIFEVPQVIEIIDPAHKPIFEGPAVISAKVKKAGKEVYINVFAVAMRGD